MKKFLFVFAFAVAAVALAETPYWDESQYTHKDLVAPTAVEGDGATLSFDTWVKDTVLSAIPSFFSSFKAGLLLLLR